MTYKGDKIIGKPSLALIEIYIAEKGLYCDPKDCYNYWEAKNWETAKHREVKTLEAAIISYNGIVVNRASKKKAKELGITKLSKKKRKSGEKAIRKEFLAGNKGLDNFIKLEKFGINVSKPQKAKKELEFTPYDEQLKDKRWEAFRKFVFAIRGRKCEHCGATKNLQVHHPKYVFGRKAWEYTCNEVEVVCRECHKKIHNIKD